MTEETDPPPGFTYLEGGKLWPLNREGNPVPTPVQADRERALQEKITEIEAEEEAARRNAPAKSFNTLERERLQDEANERARRRR